MTEKRIVTDAWDWREDTNFQALVDADISLDFSQTLWDELTRNDLEPKSFCSAPITDALVTDDDSVPFSRSSQESLEGDGESATVRGGDSPRLKKRRLFNGPQATFSSVIGDAPPSVQQMLQPLKLFEDPLRHDEDRHGILSSMPAIWYASNDDSQLSSGDNNSTLEPMSENWITTCIEENDSTVFHSHNKGPPLELANQTAGGSTPIKALRDEVVVVQGPLTPFSSQPSTPVNRTTAVKKLNLSMPVAYPFTLVKPLGIEGDVTLMDINQLISTPPRSALISNSSVSSSDQQPNTKVDYRVGLSGKSVVTRTRICTEGNGTITILRTKG
ncbi:unnamed protein product [Sphagnum compactum]